MDSNNQNPIPPVQSDTDIPPALLSKEQKPDSSQEVSTDQRKATKPKNSLLPIMIILLIFVVLGILGYFLFQKYFTLPKGAITGIIPTPIETINPTAKWNTYTTTGYSLKYPLDWKITSEDNTSLKLQPLNALDEFQPAITISYNDNLEDKTLAELHEEAKSWEIYYGTYDPSLPTIDISGEKAVYKKDFNCEPLDCDYYVLLHNKKIYYIADLFLSPDNEGDKNLQRQIFNEILSTFSFKE